MTASEQDAEIAYRMDERLGILCGDQPATIQQEMEALKEGEEAVSKIVEESSGPNPTS